MRKSRAFSLTELLCVVAIIIIVMAFATPAMSSLLQAFNLTRSGQMLVDATSLARQIAAARNRSVEVRLVRLSTPLFTGYSGVQVWVSDSSGVPVAVDRLARFPEGFLINESTALSPLFNPTASGTGTMTVSGSSVAYRSIKIRPSGIVEPVQTGTDRSRLYVTIVPGRNATDTAAPANYMTLQINPDTGTPIAYRP